MAVEPAPPAQNPAWPAATSGAIRGGRAVVRLDAPPPPGTVPGLLAALAGGGEAQLWAEPGQARFEIDLSPLPGPVDSLRPILRLSGGEERVLDPGPGWELHELLPLDPDAALRRVFLKGGRHRDPGTQSFVMEQVLAAPGCDPVHRIEAAKVLAYRAMEEGEGLEAALGQVDRALGWAARLPRREGVLKDNRTHATLSLRYVRACLLLFLGRIGACRAELGRLRAGLGPIGRCPTSANNAGLGLALLGYLELRLGEPARAAATWDEGVRLFRRAARAYPAAPAATFAELEVPFAAARFCAASAEAVRCGEPARHPGLSGPEAARACLRLRRDRNLDRAVAILEELGPLPAGPTPTPAWPHRAARWARRRLGRHHADSLSPAPSPSPSGTSSTEKVTASR